MLFNRGKQDWSTQLSFHNLASEGLIQNYHEYTAIDRAFKHKNAPSTFVLNWLRNQKGHFRNSYLHDLLMTGYSRTSKPSLFNAETIPKDIQNIVLFYVNLIFIKLYTKSDTDNDINYTIRTFDCNFSINNLRKIIETTENVRHFSDLRLWTRFNTIKFIYSVQKYGSNERVYTDSYHDEEGLKGDKERARWVEIPRDYCKQLLFKDVDDELEHHQVLEFGVDKLKKIYIDERLGSVSRATIKCITWSFKVDIDDDKEENKYDGDYNHFEFIQSLKIGDIVDVYVGFIYRKGFIFGRDYDTFYILIEDEIDNKTWDIEIKTAGIDNLHGLRRHNSRCTETQKLFITERRAKFNLL
mmetsp:Transcript_34090/g.29900  ORF Transcript_34090/g.29900 Transcript_34090/m.29900 type:complete len:355 (-) Transcript_34090:277-1341(-)